MHENSFENNDEILKSGEGRLFLLILSNETLFLKKCQLENPR